MFRSKFSGSSLGAIFGVLLICLSLLAFGQASKRVARNQRDPLASVEAQLTAGDLAGADESLLSLLSSQPDNIDALLLLGIVRGRQERFPEAEALFKRVLHSEPHSLVARRNLAQALLSEGKLSESADQYEQAIKMQPRDVDLKVDCAQIRMRMGGFAAALKLLDSIPVAELPRSAAPVKAATLLGLNQRKEAEAEIPLARGSSETALQLTDVFLSANLPDDALKSLSFVAPASKHSARFYYLEGKAFREKGELTPALKDLRQALSEDAYSLPVLVALSEIYSVQGDHAGSAQMLRQAHDLDPHAAPVLRHLAMEEMQAGHNHAAVEAATTLQSQSKEPDDQYLLATALLQDGQYDAAGTVLQRYLGQRPTDAKAMLGLGMVYINQQSYDEARKVLEQALRVQPGFPEAEYNLGVIAKKQGRSEDAIQYFQQSLEGKPDNAAAWFDLGSLELERSKFSEAENALRKSLALDPNGIQTEYNLGLAFSKLGKPDEAQQHMQRYQQLLKAERARQEQEQSKHSAN